jgi:hypothetical protein
MDFKTSESRAEDGAVRVIVDEYVRRGHGLRLGRDRTGGWVALRVDADDRGRITGALVIGRGRSRFEAAGTALADLEREAA